MPLDPYVVVKYIAAGFSAAYGLYATVTDFKEEKHGKKVLSTKGYIGILMLGISSVLSVSTDYWKDKRDELEKHQREAKEEAARLEVGKQLSDQLHQTQSIVAELSAQKQQGNKILSGMEETVELGHRNTVAATGILTQTERILRPIRGIKFSSTVELPSDNPNVRAYIDRIDPAMRAIASSSLGVWTDDLRTRMSVRSQPLAVEIGPRSSLYPRQVEDEILSAVVNYFDVQVELFRSPQGFARALTSRDEQPGDISIRIFTYPSIAPSQKNGNTLVYDLLEHKLLIEAFEIETEPLKNSGRLLSIADVQNGSVLFRVGGVLTTRNNQAEERELQRNIKWRYFIIKTLDSGSFLAIDPPLVGTDRAKGLNQYGGTFSKVFHLMH